MRGNSQQRVQHQSGVVTSWDHVYKASQILLTRELNKRSPAVFSRPVVNLKPAIRGPRLTPRREKVLNEKQRESLAERQREIDGNKGELCAS